MCLPRAERNRFWRHRRVGVLVAAVLLAGLPWTQAWAGFFSSAAQEAGEHFKRDDFDTAAALFRDDYRRGVALYRAERYPEAAEAFEAVTRPAIALDAQYNLGNARFKMADYQAAVAAYGRVLETDPNHDDARHNLMLAQHMLALLDPDQQERPPVEAQKPRDPGRREQAAGTERQRSEEPPPREQADEQQPQEQEAQEKQESSGQDSEQQAAGEQQEAEPQESEEQEDSEQQESGQQQAEQSESGEQSSGAQQASGEESEDQSGEQSGDSESGEGAGQVSGAESGQEGDSAGAQSGEEAAEQSAQQAGAQSESRSSDANAEAYDAAAGGRPGEDTDQVGGEQTSEGGNEPSPQDSREEVAAEGQRLSRDETGGTTSQDTNEHTSAETGEQPGKGTDERAGNENGNLEDAQNTGRTREQTGAEAVSQASEQREEPGGAEDVAREQLADQGGQERREDRAGETGPEQHEGEEGTGQERSEEPISGLDYRGEKLGSQQGRDEQSRDGQSELPGEWAAGSADGQDRPRDSQASRAVDRFDQLGRRSEGVEDATTPPAPGFGPGGQGGSIGMMPTEMLVEQWLDRIEADPARLLRNQFRVEEQREWQSSQGSLLESQPW